MESYTRVRSRESDEKRGELRIQYKQNGTSCIYQRWREPYGGDDYGHNQWQRAAQYCFTNLRLVISHWHSRLDPCYPLLISNEGKQHTCTSEDLEGVVIMSNIRSAKHRGNLNMFVVSLLCRLNSSIPSVFWTDSEISIVERISTAERSAWPIRALSACQGICQDDARCEAISLE